MITAAVQPSRLCRPVHDRHQAHFWTGQRRRGHLSRRVRHCTTIIRRAGRIAGRRRAPNTPGVNHRNTAREATYPRHHCPHLLRHVCRENQTVRSRSHTAPRVPVRPRSVARRHQSNGEGGQTTFFVANRAEGLPHLGTCLPVLPALQSLPSHSNSTGRFYPSGSPFSARPCTLRWALPNISSLHILPHCSRPLHPLARSHPHPGHHSRHRGTCPTGRLDIPLRFPADHNRPGMSVRIPTFPHPGQDVWHSTLADDRQPPRG
jgi:hypothetical protein